MIFQNIILLRTFFVFFKKVPSVPDSILLFLLIHITDDDDVTVILERQDQVLPCGETLGPAEANLTVEIRFGKAF